jgi:Domain of unknown function (DUF397)
MVGLSGIDLSGAVWRKSTRSSMQGNNCVELARAPGVYAVRDSKHPDGALLVFDRDEWCAFVDSVKNAEFPLCQAQVRDQGIMFPK